MPPPTIIAIDCCTNIEVTLKTSEDLYSCCRLHKHDNVIMLSADEASSLICGISSVGTLILRYYNMRLYGDGDEYFDWLSYSYFCHQNLLIKADITKSWLSIVIGRRLPSWDHNICMKTRHTPLMLLCGCRWGWCICVLQNFYLRHPCLRFFAIPKGSIKSKHIFELN